ncbi:odorant receptor 10-like isoform X1 [Megalopta genalis]|uniref:odorant receptor 10-like isoform X1 n=1 Tax=Megalopta genalis TaxID=115081 RepID=UPI003FD200DE
MTKPIAVREQDVSKSRNPYYEDDIIYIFKITKWILNSIGIWPSLLENSNQFLPKIVIGLWNVILLFAIVPFTLYLSIEEKDMMARFKLIGLYTFCTMTLLKYWALTAYKSNLKYCIEFVQHDWKEVKKGEDRKLMLKYGNVGRNLTIICLVFMYSGGFMYHTIMPYAIGTSVDEHNRTIKPLVYPMYSGFFNPQESSYYELVYAAHCLCGYMITSVTIGACALAALFITHVCGQVDIMILKLQNLTDIKENTNLHLQLVNIVQHHIRMLRFSTVVGTLLQEVCLMEFIGTTFIICTLEYYTVRDWNDNNRVGLVTYFLLLLSFMFNMFILCYIGELLVEKTGNVGLLCFTIDWYHLPVDTMRGLILIIGVSRFPSKISAGQIADLNLSTFGSVMKTSLAYLSVLRTTIA